MVKLQLVHGHGCFDGNPKTGLEPHICSGVDYPYFQGRINLIAVKFRHEGQHLKRLDLANDLIHRISRANGLLKICGPEIRLPDIAK